MDVSTDLAASAGSHALVQSLSRTAIKSPSDFAGSFWE
jgi:hypothetical protein